MTAPKLVLLVVSFIILGPPCRSETYTPKGEPDEMPGITVLKSDEKGIIIDISLAGYNARTVAVEGKPFIIPEFYGAKHIQDKGSPDLPALVQTISLPPQGDFSCKIVSAEFDDYSMVDVYPSAGMQVRSCISSQPEFSTVYSEDSTFPAEVIQYGSPFIIRNQRGVAISIVPFRYNPVKRTLRVIKQLVIEVSFVPGKSVNELSERDINIVPFTGLSPLNKRPYEAKSVNPVYSSSSLTKKSMIIICPAAFRETMVPLAEWKNKTGIETEILTPENLSDPVFIKEVIRSHYYSKGNLSYVLIAGDAEQVPAFPYPYGVSDNYYGCVAGDDHYPDIMVGRFSAENAMELKVQVDRTIEYERNPSLAGRWFENAMAIGSEMGPCDDNEKDYEHLRNLLTVLKSTTYKKVFELYDGNQGGEDKDGDPNAQMVIDGVNQGCGLILYAGHGSSSTWGTSRFNKSSVELLKNNGKYPFIFSAACENGNFAGKSCLAEAWLRAHTENWEPLGAVAALMASSVQTTFPPMEAQDKIIEAVAASGNPQGLKTLGEVIMSGFYSMNDMYGEYGYTCSDTWILFGDPSLSFRTAEPKQLTLMHQPSLGYGEDNFLVEPGNREVCNVSLSEYGYLLGNTTLQADIGAVTISTQPHSKKIQLTGSGFNMLPYLVDVEVSLLPGNPTVCFPVNHSRMEPISLNLSWNKGSGAVPRYFVLNFGTDNPPRNLISNRVVTDTCFKIPFTLDYQTNYFWSIDAVNEMGATLGGVMDFTTVFKPDEDFEPKDNPSFAWQSTGSSLWNITELEAFNGSNSIRSGSIGNNEFSSLKLSCNVNSCDFLSFWFKISSEADADKLGFYINDMLQEAWSGTQDWKYFIMNIQPGDYTFEWRYSKNSVGSSGEDAAWIDDIHLPVHQKTTYSIVPSAAICADGYYLTEGRADNFHSISWSSSGNGAFSDSNLVNALYKPGFNDIHSGETTLEYLILGYPGCESYTGNVKLVLHPLPEINIPADTLVKDAQSVELDAGQGYSEYQWNPGNLATSTYVVDSAGVVNGVKVINLKVVNQYGCSSEKTIRVHFLKNSPKFRIYPNPVVDSKITLESLNGAIGIKDVAIYDLSGKMLWKDIQQEQIVTKTERDLPSLLGGSYFLQVTDTQNNRSTNKLVVIQ